MRAWAYRWAIPQQAIDELIAMATPHPERGAEGSEAAVQQRVRLEASRRGMRLFRNNVGVLYDETGRPVRFGLANETPAVNKKLKSSDLIGISPVVIRAEHVGHTVGVFTSYECKRPGWEYKGTGREAAQFAWISLVRAMGGIAKFITRGDQL